MSQICHTVCTSATAIQHRLYVEYPVRSTPCVYTTTEYSTEVLRLCASWITIRNALWLILKQLPYCPVLSPVGSDCTERPNRHIRVQAFFCSRWNGIQSNKRVRVCTVCMSGNLDDVVCPSSWDVYWVRSAYAMQDIYWKSAFNYAVHHRGGLRMVHRLQEYM